MKLINIIDVINNYFFDIPEGEQLPIISDALFFYVPLLLMPIILIVIWFI